jgi:hypothetical protein
MGSAISFASQILYFYFYVYMYVCCQDKRPQHPHNSSVGKPQSQSGHSKKQKNFCTCWELNPNFSIIQATALLLYQLSYPCPYMNDVLCFY